MQDPNQALRTARRWQSMACLGMLACISISALALEAAVHDRALGVWMDIEWTKVNGTPNLYQRQFRDAEDRLLLEDIPALDPSAGGVYFFGASNMKWAMSVPDLPSPERKLVHNFGAGEGSPYFHRQFTEFLVDHKDILRAGPKKTLIVYGTCFVNAKRAINAPSTLFTTMWGRYGLYRYDFQQGIEPVTRGAILDAYSLEKARCASCMQGLMDHAERLVLPKALRRRNNSHDPQAYADSYKIRMGPHWEDGIEKNRQELQAWFDYVRSHNMEFQIVLLPLASWHKPLPYPAKYREMIEDFCTANHVPLTDCSNLVTDDDFDDHIHVNSRGLIKINAKLMEIAAQFLREHKVWPAETPAVQ